MKNDWHQCKKILVIRPDNMGDLLMSSPALPAIKKSFGCSITLLTSSMAQPITPFLTSVDDVIVYDFPWVKCEKQISKDSIYDLVAEIKKQQFDGAILFTVYSQNPMPSLMIAWLASIPRRLAYCRENPYDLLTHWVPDKEPYSFIQHQVKRDLHLVNFIGAETDDDRLKISTQNKPPLLNKILSEHGIDSNRPWLIIHAAVSESKRKFPLNDWITVAKGVIKQLNYQVIFTGGPSDKKMTDDLAMQTEKDAFSLAGKISMEVFILLIKEAPLVISVNTVTMHITAATNTPLIALYALTNPQHTPWKAKGKLFPFAIESNVQSRNEVIQFVTQTLHPTAPFHIDPQEIINAAHTILYKKQLTEISAIKLKKYAMDQLPDPSHTVGETFIH